jgi:hypothetical protein
MHILYHNCPSQRTLVVTHSNQALNDLFTKVGKGWGSEQWARAVSSPLPVAYCCSMPHWSIPA